MPYEMPAVINAVGGIDLHGREGIQLVFRFGEADLIAQDLWFEVDGLFRNELTVGATVYEKIITISQADVRTIWEAGTPRGSSRLFTVRRYDVTPPQVLWEGRIAIRGYIEEPPA